MTINDGSFFEYNASLTNTKGLCILFNVNRRIFKNKGNKTELVTGKEWKEERKKKWKNDPMKEKKNTNSSISSLAFSTKSFIFLQTNRKLVERTFRCHSPRLSSFWLKFLRYFRKVTHTQAHNHTHIRIHINIYAYGMAVAIRKIGIRNTVLLYRYNILMYIGPTTRIQI